MDWSVNTLQFLALKEVHGIFLDSFLISCKKGIQRQQIFRPTLNFEVEKKTEKKSVFSKLGSVPMNIAGVFLKQSVQNKKLGDSCVFGEHTKKEFMKIGLKLTDLC